MAEPHKISRPNADANLEALGYTAELSRNRSTWQVVFMCFILASVPYGLSTTMSYSIVGGGSANMIWGWLVVSLIMLCVGASLAEITSVYPTAGGVYYQTFALSPHWCRRATAWICGWSYVAGNITITLAVNFATALFLVESLNVFKNEAGEGIAANFETWQTYLIFVAITLLCHVIPAFMNKWLTHIEVCFLRDHWILILIFIVRLLPSSGLWSVLVPSSSLSLSSPTMAGARRSGCLVRSSPSLAGRMAGRSVSVCFRLRTVFRPPEW